MCSKGGSRKRCRNCSGSALKGRVWLGLVGLVAAYARAGDRRAAEQTLTELEDRARRGHVPPFAVVVASTALGDRAAAFRWLNTAVDTRDEWLTENFFDPLLDPLRADPRFAAVRQRMGLAGR